ncbi:serine--tRNA ligase-like isoform X2 [Hyalella azteca]|uniref:Serine--tRNA ligase-like isoform X2 n=1 Tax=Hyalella azteca TaxID=294128 RepID=A0A979FJM8_HYAAZ|nr:serine--tRNA ligase-like isoform X2 [Hyalella azteca]
MLLLNAAADVRVAGLLRGTSASCIRLLHPPAVGRLHPRGGPLGFCAPAEGPPSVISNYVEYSSDLRRLFSTKVFCKKTIMQLRPHCRGLFTTHPGLSGVSSPGVTDEETDVTAETEGFKMASESSAGNKMASESSAGNKMASVQGKESVKTIPQKPDIRMDINEQQSSTQITEERKDMAKPMSFRHRLSHLYVAGHMARIFFAPVTPFLDMDARLAAPEDLLQELQLRQVSEEFGGLEGLQELKDSWQEFKELKHAIEELEKQADELTVTSNEMKGKEDVKDDEVKVRISQLRSKTKILKARLNELEVTAIPAMLDLPNTVNLPPGDGGVVVSLNDPPIFDFSPKPHTLLRTQSPNSLEFLDVSPGAFYLSGDLAECEVLLDRYWTGLLDAAGYLRQCNPDFAKEVLVEGCGGASSLKTQLKEEDKTPVYLVGGASLPAYLGYFARRAVKKTSKFLPQKLYACQRTYTPLRDLCPPDRGLHAPHEGLYAPQMRGVMSSMQSTSVSLLTMYTNESKFKDLVKDEVLGVVVQAYQKLGLHFRIVRPEPRDLRVYERDALVVQMLSTSYPEGRNTVYIGENKMTYIEVGRISIIGDYISKRLLMMYVKDGARASSTSPRDGRAATGAVERLGFLQAVYAQAMDVTRVLAVAVENLQDAQGEANLGKLIDKLSS